MSIKLGSTNISLVNQGSTISNRGYLGINVVYGTPLVEYNLFIGNMADIFPTTTSLSTTLSCTDTDILNYSIIDNNIRCYVNVPYTILDSAFRANAVSPGSSITYFIATSNLTSIGNNCFVGQSFMKKIHLVEDVYLAGSVFWQNTRATHYNLPLVTRYGNVPNDDTIFKDSNSNAVLIAEPTMETINGGGLDPDLDYFQNTQGGTIVFKTNTIPPNPITDLSIGTIYYTDTSISWSAPTATNGINRYEVYINGCFHDFTTNINYNLYDLTHGESYTFYVKTIDGEGNESTSNEILQNINGVNELFEKTSMISSYEFDETSLPCIDSVSGHNMTGTYQTLGALGHPTTIPKPSRSVYMYNKNLYCSNTTDHSFTNGTSSDTPFSVNIVFYKRYNDTTTYFVSKWGDGINKEWVIYQTSNTFGFRLHQQSTGGYIEILEPMTYNVNTWYKLGVTYDGSGLASGLNMYWNGVKVTGTKNTVGSYSYMEIDSQGVSIGSTSWSSTTNPFKGDISSLHIIGTELTSTQMISLHQKIIDGYEV